MLSYWTRSVALDCLVVVGRTLLSLFSLRWRSPMYESYSRPSPVRPTDLQLRVVCGRMHARLEKWKLPFVKKKPKVTAYTR